MFTIITVVIVVVVIVIFFKTTVILIVVAITSYPRVGSHSGAASIALCFLVYQQCHRSVNELILMSKAVDSADSDVLQEQTKRWRNKGLKRKLEAEAMADLLMNQSLTPIINA